MQTKHKHLIYTLALIGNSVLFFRRLKRNKKELKNLRPELMYYYTMNFLS